MTTSLAKKEKEQLPAAMQEMFAAEAGAGFENADKDSFAIPFLKMLQAMSPQCTEGNAAYREDARPGMILNTVSDELIDGKEGFDAIPVHYERIFLEWEGTKPGSGLVGIHDVATGLKLLKQCTRDDKNNEVMPNGHCLVDARQHYLLAVAKDGTATPSLIGMSKSQLKVSKKWMTGMDMLRLPNGQKPPMFASLYRVSTVSEQNRDGDTYKNWSVARVGYVENAEHFEMAKAFREALIAGAAQVDHSQMTDGPTNAERDPFDEDYDPLLD